MNFVDDSNKYFPKGGCETKVPDFERHVSVQEHVTELEISVKNLLKMEVSKFVKFI